MLAAGVLARRLRAAVSLRAVTPAQQARWLKILAAVFADHGHKLIEKKLTKEELIAQIGQYDGLVVRSGVKVTEEIIRAGSKLRIIGRAGAGVDNIDAVAATRKGALVMNTPGGNTSAAAELTLSLLMSMARQIPAAVQSLKGGVWDRKTFSKGVELRGKTVGVVGLGMIGAEVARRCQALDMTTIGFDPLVTDERAAAAGVRKVTLDELWAKSDFITIHTPLNDATRNLICKATLAKCKPGVYILNVARGGVVHEADLLEALNEGKVAGAALDVFESEPPKEVSKALIAHPRVVATPHLGASTEEAQKKVAREIAAQMCDAFAGRAFYGVTNAPYIALAYKPALEPFVRLAEALGSLQGQMWGAAPTKHASISVDVEGAAFAAAGSEAHVRALIKAAILKGLLPALPGLELREDANIVNAPMLAEEAGLRVAVRQAAAVTGSYANAVRVSVVTAAGREHSVMGSVIEGAPRIVQLDHWASFPSFSPAGHILLFNNADRPGAVGRVTSVLADHNVNVANLSVVRQYPGSPALSILITDSRLPAEVRARVEALEGISNVRCASFDGHYMAPAAGIASDAAATAGVDAATA